MITPAWILEIFAAVMILVAEVSAGQLTIARAWTHADIAVSQLLVGIALAGMLVPGLNAVPNTVWEVVFAVMTAWFGWCLWREGRRRGAVLARGHYAPHLVYSAAMFYLFAALAGPPLEGSATPVSGSGGMPGMAGGSSSGPHASTLALIFALLLIAFTVHDLDRPAGVDGYFQVAGRRSVPERAPAAYTAERLLLSPAVVKGCQVAIGVTMAFILIIMI
jgi:Domain of unknown function (DUF5134)